MTEPDDVAGHQLSETLFTHTVLYHAAQASLEEGRADGRTERFMVAQLMAAFALEAYLNFAGESLFPFWAEVERIATSSKLGMICKHLKFEPAFGKRPYQTISELWKVRNALAHARTKSLSEVRPGPPTEPVSYPKPDWHKACVLDRSEHAVEDVKAVADELHERGKLQIGRMGMISVGGGEILRSLRPGEKSRGGG